ncbi:MAG: 5'-nucleotidase C-terminal domain-containing protein [Paludibacteraceae bacterium]|nr:5'-nucleotidase C-terminal domain-containing protein [Paludibacteraceae bacterium]
MRKYIIIALCSALLVACDLTPRQVVSAKEELIAVDKKADKYQDTAYIRMLQPKSDSLERQLDVVIGYAPEALTVKKPECTMLNWATDALYDMAKEVYKGEVDFAVTNIGGMRTNWQAGDITRRQVYELMPFDNRLVILTLEGKEVRSLCNVFARQGGQGVTRQLRMEIKDKKAQNIRLNGRKIVDSAVYYVATSDYLSTGADNFTPLTRAIEKHETRHKIRDLYMKYIETRKTVKAEVDGRMKKIN